MSNNTIPNVQTSSASRNGGFRSINHGVTRQQGVNYVTQEQLTRELTLMRQELQVAAPVNTPRKKKTLSDKNLRVCIFI
jgi:hypothetical protein